jgi:hypothetical protein
MGRGVVDSALPVDRDAELDGGPPAGIRADLEGTADESRALVHPEKPEPLTAQQLDSASNPTPSSVTRATISPSDALSSTRAEPARA